MIGAIRATTEGQEDLVQNLLYSRCFTDSRPVGNILCPGPCSFLLSNPRSHTISKSTTTKHHITPRGRQYRVLSTSQGREYPLRPLLLLRRRGGRAAGRGGPRAE